MKKCYSLIQTKANNRNAIRVLYKKVGQSPEIKIINNVYRLKKAIFNKKLEIVPYQSVYIICHNKKQMKNMRKNIILDFSHIAGDFLVVEIDRKKREFQSISQENIIWFTEDLMNRSPIQKSLNPKIDVKYFSNCASSELKTFNKTKNNNNFENDLINVLSSIGLTLSCLVTNNKKGGN